MNRAEIAERLPHGPGMVLLDRVISWSAQEIVCGARSHRAGDNPLRTPRGLSPLAGIEYAGQAIAVHASLAGGLRSGVGVLAALRDVRWQPGDLALGGEELIVRAVRLAHSGDAANYRFSVGFGGRDVLAGTALVTYRKATS